VVKGVVAGLPMGRPRLYIQKGLRRVSDEEKKWGSMGLIVKESRIIDRKHRPSQPSEEKRTRGGGDPGLLLSSTVNRERPPRAIRFYKGEKDGFIRWRVGVGGKNSGSSGSVSTLEKGGNLSEREETSLRKITKPR